MSDPIQDLDTWLRGDFIAINTQLEEAYFARRHDAPADHSRRVVRRSMK